MTQSLLDSLDQSNPNSVPNALRDARLGQALSKNAVIHVRAAVVDDVLVLPNNRKAGALLAARSLAGSTTGPITPVVEGTDPATTQCVIDKDGNIEFEDVTDEVTLAEVVYAPLEGDLLTERVNVVSGTATLQGSRKCRLLLSATVVAGVVAEGTALGTLARGAAATSGNAAAQEDGTIDFHSDDIVNGTADIAYIAFPGEGDGVLDSLAQRLDANVAY